MYVKIDETKYTEISKLQFEPETDITGNTIPVNDMWVSIRTSGYIELGSRVSLYDDLDKLWCKYWVTYAEHEDERTVRVHGVSAVSRLDTVTLDAKMYENQSVSSVLWEILGSLSGEYEMDESFNSERIDGYCPKQSARVRLQWVCMSIGAYVRHYFGDSIQILPIDETTETVIPLSDTYWKPKVTYNDYVTAVRTKYYQYYQRLPSNTEEYVTIGDKSKGETETHYVQESTQVTLTNPDVPPAAHENVVDMEGMTLTNSRNVDEIVSFMSKYRFNRTEMDLEAVNNGDYIPGMRVYAYMDEDTMVQGYIESCSFSFGLQAKASMHLTPVEVIDSAVLEITYEFGEYTVGVRKFRLPVGYGFSIQNPYVDMTFNRHRYILRPVNATCDGTMVQEGIKVTESMERALELFDGYLTTESVDKLTQTDGDVVIS